MNKLPFQEVDQTIEVDDFFNSYITPACITLEKMQKLSA